MGNQTRAAVSCTGTGTGRTDTDTATRLGTMQQEHLQCTVHLTILVWIKVGWQAWHHTAARVSRPQVISGPPPSRGTLTADKHIVHKDGNMSYLGCWAPGTLHSERINFPRAHPPRDARAPSQFNEAAERLSCSTPLWQREPASSRPRCGSHSVPSVAPSHTCIERFIPMSRYTVIIAIATKAADDARARRLAMLTTCETKHNMKEGHTEASSIGTCHKTITRQCLATRGTSGIRVYF